MSEHSPLVIPPPTMPELGENDEVVDFTFEEEPLGLLAEQGYGYLQIEFGQRIGPNQRYEILRKLGWGMNASVWLARDHEANCFVAIKALTGAATSLHHKGVIQELAIMQHVTTLTQRTGKSARCVPLRTHFIQPGNPGDGEHLCLVMDVLVGDIEALRDEHGRFPPPLAKLILRDILRGLVQLHESGGVHTDLKAGNTMCNLPEATSEKTIRALLTADPSRRYPPEPSWNGPVETAVSQPMPPLPLEKALSASFMISDFGSAQLIDQQVTSNITPVTLRAPESLLQGPWDAKVDIWTFGSLASEFLYGIPLFVREHPRLDPNLWHVVQMIKFAGEEFSPEILKTYKLAPQFFDEDTGYDSIHGKPFTPNHVSNPIRRNGETIGLSEHDILGLTDLVTRCLRLNPADWLSARELLRGSTWLLELGDDSEVESTGLAHSWVGGAGLGRIGHD